MAISVRKGLKLIGPYPYNPYLIFLFFSSIFLSRFAPFISLAPSGSERWKAAALVLLASSLPGFLFAGGTLLLKKYRFLEKGLAGAGLCPAPHISLFFKNYFGGCLDNF